MISIILFNEKNPLGLKDDIKRNLGFARIEAKVTIHSVVATDDKAQFYFQVTQPFVLIGGDDEKENKKVAKVVARVVSRGTKIGIIKMDFLIA